MDPFALIIPLPMRFTFFLSYSYNIVTVLVVFRLVGFHLKFISKIKNWKQNFHVLITTQKNCPQLNFEKFLLMIEKYLKLFLCVNFM